MEDDPIESDDPLEMCAWHAHERIRAIETEMKALRQRYASLSHLRVRWQDHARAVEDAQRTRADTNDDGDEVPTQKCAGSLPVTICVRGETEPTPM